MSPEETQQEEEQPLRILIEMSPLGEPLIGSNVPFTVLEGISILELAKQKMVMQYWQGIQEASQRAALLSPKLLIPTKNL